MNTAFVRTKPKQLQGVFTTFPKESIPRFNYVNISKTLLRTLLIVAVLYVGATTPELRILAAKGLRLSADWIDLKDSSRKSQSVFERPRTFSQKEEW